jgi:HK97 family phage prohead protease
MNTAVRIDQMLQVRRAPVGRNSFNPDTRTFAAVAATTQPVRRFDPQFGDVLEQLSLQPGAVRLDRLNSGRSPLLDTHRTGALRDVIGRVLNARIENSQLLVDLQLSDRDDVESIAADVASGVIQSVSVGYLVHGRQIVPDPNGGIPTALVTDWEPFEVSLTPIGADENAHVRSLKGATEMHRAIPSGSAATATVSATLPAPRDSSPVETRQFLDIAAAFNVPVAFVTRHLADGTPIEAFRDACQNEAAHRNAPRQMPYHRLDASGTFDDPEFLSRAIGDALYARMSGKPAEGAAREWAGRSLLDMGAAILQARGERVSWTSRDRLAERIMTRGLHSTSDFPQLLTGAGNRILLEGFQAAQTPLLALGRERAADDFRPIAMIRLGEAPRLSKVPEGGEIARGTIAEAKQGFSVVTFAKIFGLTRQAIVNDDLNAFGDINRLWGRAAAETQAAELVALFTANSGNGINLDDGNPIYTTARGNKASTGAAIDVDSLGAARQALREMKGLDGATPIGVTPKHLVVGPAKETEAEKVLAELAAAQVAEVNPFSGKLTLHVEPRFTGNAWRLFADPAELPVIEYAYLTGERGPALFEREGWDVEGMEFKCRLDFGCGVSEWRGTFLDPGE